MKKTKAQKGITLIALIITIVVLLILSVVAIRAVQGDGIIAHAKNATNTYNEKQKEEETLLGNIDDYLTLQTAKPSEGLEFTSNGDGTCYFSGIGTCSDDVIVVPSRAGNGDIVVGVKNFSYSEDETVEFSKLILPESIEIIDHSFLDMWGWHCDEVVINSKKITFVGYNIPQYEGLKNNPKYWSNGVFVIGNIIFNCNIDSNVTIYTVSNGVIAIGICGFSGFDNLTTLNLPKTIQCIMDQGSLPSSLKDIYYSGTKEEWNNVIKDDLREDITIHCTDGDV